MHVRLSLGEAKPEDTAEYIEHRLREAGTDEAHLLHQDVLEHLHILANYAWDSRPLLSLVLVGLPELWGRLTLTKNRSLWSRHSCPPQPRRSEA
ncbi:MAG: ATP-binding protein [Myxococcota bacterium]